MASEKVKYPLLSDDNYHTWARRTRAALEQRRLWNAIDPGYKEDPEKSTPKQRTRDTDALNFIISNEDGTVATAYFKASYANKLGRSYKAVGNMDSGATNHMAPYRELIEDFDGSLTRTVKLANGECAKAKDSVSITSAVLDLVHSDVVGRITPPSLGGAEHFVTFMDDYSRYPEVNILNRNLMLLKPSNNIKAWLKFFKKEKIKALQSDNGGEYIGKEFEKHLRHKGILHRKTAPNSPQHNGKGERLNQTFMNITRFQEGIKCYRLWRLSDKRIIVSRDVHFYEHVCPFKTQCSAKPLVHEQGNVEEIPAVEERNDNEESEKLHPPDIRGSASVNQLFQRAIAQDQIEVRVDQGDRNEHIESETFDCGESGQRRSTKGRREQHTCCSLEVNLVKDPKSVQEAIHGSDGHLWLQAMEE
ncbi:hypothetical protein PR048_007387 [Dryococelus australis]|uniref:Integrase catalytic domain-containing protein n=1 Tax=Dryococelus australis TaxID=614101 RepID=A0ABQ9HVR6_9NEOP|nr:hypothetical protein PR048_007387 [Dryococelus australis]